MSGFDKNIFICGVQWPNAMHLLPALAGIFRLDTFHNLSQLQHELFAYKKRQTSYKLALKHKLDFPVILRH